MIIVVTGPAFSGRMEMAEKLLLHLPEAEPFPLITHSKKLFAWDKESMLSYSTKADFEAMSENSEFLYEFESGGTSFGISRDLVSDPKKIYIVTCDPDVALMVSKLFQELDVVSLCVYMHCSLRTLMFRRSGEVRASASSDLHFIQDIYGDHSLKFGQLLADTEKGRGFNKIIPVNSDRLASSSYWNEVVKPLTSRLISEAV